ncbi:acyltransferase [Pedobacter yulinensis]|uniref:Acyltransferase n=1 Tax=Pedobacter yulinensis TaxID=2126353 RepID=A0A2T3HLW5_9SPHI|nr:acyltransferase [Pedobacter yulinensis]PST83416.1 acyltransferase [Pedobacter yulinensis]
MTANTSPTGLLQSKQHFAILDGLRGVAALAVVIFHFMEIVKPNPADNFIAHAYLAVDFFFCLSGFVMAYAYDDKLPSLGTWNFFKLRLIRLHPLVIIGSVIGLVLFVTDPFSNLAEKYSSQILALFLTSCFMIPYPIVPERYLNLFHLNAPTWSLFWEYIANIVYAFVLIRLGKKMLWVLLVLAALAVCYEAWKTGFLSVGWGGDNVSGGAIRVSYSFLAGILIYRSNWIIKTRLGFLPLAIVAMLIFMVPFDTKTSPFVDPLLIMFCSPLLVALGAGAVLRPAFDKLCRLSGELSYPLYMVHYPFIWIFYSYLEKFRPGMTEMGWITAIGTILLVLFAYVVMRWVDIPLRNFLRRRFIKKAA